jgi:hypothetical protein
LECHSADVRGPQRFGLVSRILARIEAASASYDKTVKIWGAATGTLQQTVAVNGYISSLLFDIADSILITNIGRIKLDKTELPSLSETSEGEAVKTVARD